MLEPLPMTILMLCKGYDSIINNAQDNVINNDHDSIINSAHDNVISNGHNNVINYDQDNIINLSAIFCIECAEYQPRYKQLAVVPSAKTQRAPTLVHVTQASPGMDGYAHYDLLYAQNQFELPLKPI